MKKHKHNHKLIHTDGQNLGTKREIQTTESRSFKNRFAFLTAKKELRTWQVICLMVAAGVGVICFVVIASVRLGLTKTAGSIDAQSAFWRTYSKEKKTTLDTGVYTKESIACTINTISTVYPATAINFSNTFQSSHSTKTLGSMIILLREIPEVSKNTQLIGKLDQCLKNPTHSPTLSLNAYAWANSEEWFVLKDAFLKEKDVINQVSKETGVPARLIVSTIVSEQLRVFTSSRQTFKEIFLPLRVLGTQTQFSLGVSGFKDLTAKMVEDNLKDSSSPYYLGPAYEHMLDYEGEATEEARFLRFSSYTDHRYSYLYTALFIKQIEAQWKRAGYPIDDRPEIISTIFNLGFPKSTPKANPEVGGSDITVGGTTYTFGRLGGEFYYSGEMGDAFGF